MLYSHNTGTGMPNALLATGRTYYASNAAGWVTINISFPTPVYLVSGPATGSTFIIPAVPGCSIIRT